MFGMGMGELLLIFLVALIVVGPERLPTAAKAIGKGIRDFRRHTMDLQNSLEQDETIGEAVRELKSALHDHPIRTVTPPPKPIKDSPASQVAGGGLLDSSENSQPHTLTGTIDTGPTIVRDPGPLLSAQGAPSAEMATVVSEPPSMTDSQRVEPEPLIRPSKHSVAKGEWENLTAIEPTSPTVPAIPNKK